jgi:hypothetical protein
LIAIPMWCPFQDATLRQVRTPSGVPPPSIFLAGKLSTSSTGAAGHGWV